MRSDTIDLLCTLMRAIDTPIEEARALPPQAYLNDELYDLELEHLFRRDWICVGRQEDAPTPGSYFAVEFVGEPVVVVRGQDGVLRAFSNVCRHRYMQVVEGAGRAPRLVCPYHGWAYHLDGSMASAPQMSESRVFKKEACRLPEYRLEVWLGFVFVNLDPCAEPMSPRLAPLAERLAPYRIDEMRSCALYDAVWPGNWKLTMENNGEAYHHTALHPRSLEPWMPGATSYCEDDHTDWSVLHTPLDVARLRADAPAYAALIERWSEDIPEAYRTETLTYLLFPATTVDVSPGLCFWKRVWPLDRCRTRILMGALVPPDSLTETLSQQTSEFFELLNPEDAQATWKLNGTVSSRSASPGPLSSKEACLLHFQRYLGRRLGNARVLSTLP